MFDKLTQTPQDQVKKDPKKMKRGRLGCALLLGIFLIIVLGAGGDKDTKKVENTPVVQNNGQKGVSEEVKEIPKEEVALDESKLPKYEVVYREKIGATEAIYIVMEPITLQGDFQKNIKNILKNVASKEGYDKSYIVYDDKPFFEEYTEKYIKVQKTPGSSFEELQSSVQYMKSPVTSQKQARHQVASTLGEKAIEMANTISYFPGAFTDNKEVGQYVKTEDFDIRNYQYQL